MSDFQLVIYEYNKSIWYRLLKNDYVTNRYSKIPKGRSLEFYLPFSKWLNKTPNISFYMVLPIEDLIGIADQYPELLI